MLTKLGGKWMYSENLKKESIRLPNTSHGAEEYNLTEKYKRGGITADMMEQEKGPVRSKTGTHPNRESKKERGQKKVKIV